MMRFVKSIVLFLALASLGQGCRSVLDRKEPAQTPFLRHVGDTAFDPKLDDPNFKVCSPERAQQYYAFDGMHYEGEKPKIEAHFRNRFKNKPKKGESGWLTIRFVVNCEGRTGWFRVKGVDRTYQPKKFDTAIEQQLLTLTKELNGWIVGKNEAGQAFDYYQYLTFKLEDGRLLEILP